MRIELEALGNEQTLALVTLAEMQDAGNDAVEQDALVMDSTPIWKEFLRISRRRIKSTADAEAQNIQLLLLAARCFAAGRLAGSRSRTF